jgi:hypothetical protein
MSQDVEADSSTGEALVGVVRHMQSTGRKLWKELYPSDELEK